MTDQELIKAAAKAAGIEGCWHDIDDGWFIPGNINNWASLIRWDPLEDNSQAFKLMVKLRMRVRTTETAAIVDIYGENGWQGEVQVGVMDADWSEDYYAATRRAIVRAAAEIGRTL